MQPNEGRTGTQSTIVGIPVYVISLKDSDVRRRNMTERLGALGIPFQFVDAIDGRTQRLPDYFDGARLVREGFRFESGLACTVSHRLVHRMIVNCRQELGLILEDDAEPSEDFPEALRNSIAFMQSNPKIDMVKLEGTPCSPQVRVGRLGSRSVFVARSPSGGSAGYLLRRSAAQRFCSLSIIDTLIDVVFADPRLALRVVELQPYPARQDRLTPELCGFQPLAERPFYIVSGRQPFLQRQMASIRKRARFIRLHGARLGVLMELQQWFGKRSPNY